MYGKKIKALRALHGWSQTDLARESGVCVDTIRRMESDLSPKAEPPIVKLLRVGLDLREG